MKWFLIVMGVLMAGAVIAIVITSVDNSRADLAFRRSVIRKVSLAILMIGATCLYVMDPRIDSYRPSGSSLKNGTEAEILESPAKYIRDNQERIERLEEALAETKDELEIWRQHYKVVINLMFWATITIAGYQLFNEKNDFFNGGDS